MKNAVYRFGNNRNFFNRRDKRAFGRLCAGRGERNKFRGRARQTRSGEEKYKAAKGNNDLISQTQAEISGLKTKIENIEKEGVALAKYYSELGELTEREKALSAELRKASAKSVEAEKWKTYGKLKETERQKTIELKAFAENTRTEFPTKTKSPMRKSCSLKRKV